MYVFFLKNCNDYFLMRANFKQIIFSNPQRNYEKSYWILIFKAKSSNH